MTNARKDHGRRLRPYNSGVRLDMKEKRLLEQAAKSSGRSLAGYIRWAALERATHDQMK